MQNAWLAYTSGLPATRMSLTHTLTSIFSTALMIYNTQRATLRANYFWYASASRRALGGAVSEFDGGTAYGSGTRLFF